MKYCTKPCPNIKCKAPISKDYAGCTHLQCTVCFTWMCWACGVPAKGQKHFKEHPECLEEEGTLLPPSLTQELISKHLGLDHDPYINIKHCAACPQCKTINQKTGKLNTIICKNGTCKHMFCYICNKSIESSAHFKVSNCHESSEVWNDL